jgi:hypothetical protein
VPLVPVVRPEPMPWLPAPVLLPPQLADSIRTDVTRTRCGSLSVVVAEADVEDERDDDVEDECEDRVLFAVDAGMIMPLTSTCWPSCPAAAEPSS